MITKSYYHIVISLTLIQTWFSLVTLLILLTFRFLVNHFAMIGKVRSGQKHETTVEAPVLTNFQMKLINMTPGITKYDMLRIKQRRTE